MFCDCRYLMIFDDICRSCCRWINFYTDVENPWWWVFHIELLFQKGGYLISHDFRFVTNKAPAHMETRCDQAASGTCQND